MLEFPSLPLAFQVVYEGLNLECFPTRSDPGIDLLLREMTLLEDILNRLNFELSFLLIVLVSQFLPLLRNPLLRVRLKVSIRLINWVPTLMLSHQG